MNKGLLKYKKYWVLSVLQYSLPGLNFCCQNGNTPCHHSADLYSEDTSIRWVDMLLKAGASPTKENKVSNYLTVVVAEYDNLSMRPSWGPKDYV